MVTLDDDRLFRTAAMSWLDDVTMGGELPVTRDQLSQFTFRGERIALVDRNKGIRKPRQFETALSILTTYRPEGSARPYDDDVGADGLPRYKWRGTDPNQADNRALREAMRRQVPLIWFWGTDVGVFKPIYPVFLIDEEPDQHQFVVATTKARRVSFEDVQDEDIMRRYMKTEVMQRMHQPVFRARIMRAYQTRCTVCELGHASLLDAAHIVEDKNPSGIAATRNGLSLCKIHHAAYDVGILGVTPKYKIAIREDILTEIDGPLLEHGLKRLHGEELRVIPSRRTERPDPDLLKIHYDLFQRNNR